MDNQELTRETILDQCRQNTVSRIEDDWEELDISRVWSLTVQNVMSDIDVSRLLRLAAEDEGVLNSKVRLQPNESRPVEAILLDKLEESLVEELVDETLDSFRRS